MLNIMTQIQAEVNPLSQRLRGASRVWIREEPSVGNIIRVITF
jgi:hypothetical protein